MIAIAETMGGSWASSLEMFQKSNDNKCQALLAFEMHPRGVDRQSAH